MSETSPKKLVGLAELSHRLQLPARWLRGEAEAGRIPSLRAGTELRFNLLAVEAALLERARGETTPAAGGGR